MPVELIIRGNPVRNPSLCPRCHQGHFKFVKYADGDSLIWTDRKGRPHYVYRCGFCGLEHRFPVDRKWDAEHPDIAHQVRRDEETGLWYA
jgi:RNase P subunit RPR2